MNVAVVDNLPIREVEFANLLGDTRLERAFDRVTTEVIRGLKASGIEKRRRIGDAFLGHVLQIEAIHSATPEDAIVTVPANLCSTPASNLRNGGTPCDDSPF